MKYSLSGPSMLMLYLLLCADPSNAFLRHLCFNPLGFGRIDPIVSPGRPAQHIHHLHGASNLGLGSANADYLLESNCTSCSITVDKSAYWAPAMYFEHENGSLSLLTTASAITIYYKFEKRANFLDRNYTVFPKGFRMVTGVNAKRTWHGPWPVPPQSRWGANDTTQEALTEKAIGFNCMNYNARPEASLAFPWIRSKEFTDANCAHGLRAELLFPSCWDGVNLDSPDHNSHVAYPTLIQDGACPDTHPIFLPVLFYETIWNTQEYIGVPGRYVLANGDPTGFGYHGDFLAAWEDGVLQQVQDDPTCTDHDINQRRTTGIQEQCNAVADHIQAADQAAECKLTTPELLQDEEIYGPLTILPGNIQITGVRHNPGEVIEGGSSYTSSGSYLSIAPSSSIDMTLQSTVHPPVSPTAASEALTTAITPAPAPQTSILTTTSTYYSDGVFVEMVIIREITRTTVTSKPLQSLLVRHKHRHAHA